MERLSLYKIGEIVRIIIMEGEPKYNGHSGTITHIDKAGNLTGTWGEKTIQPERDIIRKIKC